MLIQNSELWFNCNALQYLLIGRSFANFFRLFRQSKSTSRWQETVDMWRFSNQSLRYTVNDNMVNQCSMLLDIIWVAMKQLSWIILEQNWVRVSSSTTTAIRPT